MSLQAAPPLGVCAAEESDTLAPNLIDFAQQTNRSLPAKSICASPAARAFSHNQDPVRT